jgi:hypothetical protein
MPPMPIRSARGRSGSGSTFSSTMLTRQRGGQSAEGGGRISADEQ